MNNSHQQYPYNQQPASALRRSKYAPSTHTRSGSASSHMHIYTSTTIDENGFPTTTTPCSSSSLRSSTPTTTTSLEDNLHAISHNVSSADEILSRVRASRSKRASTIGSNGSVYSTASSHSRGNHVQAPPPPPPRSPAGRAAVNQHYNQNLMTPNTARRLDESRKASKALALEYGVALEASKGRMVALEREIAELREFKGLEDNLKVVSSLSNDSEVQLRLDSAERECNELRAQLADMQNRHNVQQSSLASTLELAHCQSEEDQHMIERLKNEANELRNELKVKSQDDNKYVKLSKTEHEEILEVLKENTEKIQTLEAMNKSLMSQNLASQKQFEDHQNEFQKTVKDLEKFHADLHAEKDEDIQKKIQEVEETKSQHDVSLKLIKSQKEQIAELEASLAATDTMKERTIELQETIKNLQEEMQEIESRAKTRVNYSQTQLKSSKDAQQIAQRAAKELNLRVKVLEVELRENNSKSAAEIQTRDATIEELENKVAHLITDNTAKLKNMQSKHEAEVNDYQQNYTKTDQFNSDIARKEKEIERLIQENKVLTAKDISLSRNMKTNSAECEKLKQECDKLKAECERLRACAVDEAELDSYRNDLLKKGKELESLKHENKVLIAKEISLNRNLKSNILETDKLRDECTRYKAECERLTASMPDEDELNLYRNKVNMLEEVLSAQSSALEQASSNKANFSVLECTISDMESQLADQKSQVESINSQLSNTMIQLTHTQSLLSEAKLENEILRCKNDDLAANISASVTEKDSEIEDVMAKYDNQVVKLVDDNNALNSLVSKLKLQNQSVESELNSTKATIEMYDFQVQETEEKYSKKVQELTAEMELLQTNLSRKEREITLLKSKANAQPNNTFASVPGADYDKDEARMIGDAALQRYLQHRSQKMQTIAHNSSVSPP
mmetsp:Transcript_14676/g.22730  ORF Transcript_14676/g.22730 Transcript_14676/m.22730 type:complete len:912 (-) Transcript_14676:27-2762(-)